MSKDRGISISSGEQKHAASARVWVNKREAILSLEIDRDEENRYTLVAIGKVTAKTSENIETLKWQQYTVMILTKGVHLEQNECLSAGDLECM